MSKPRFSEIISNNDCLFRYRSMCDQSISALEEDRLYFSAPIRFNDPYDNLIFANSFSIASEMIGNVNYGMDDYLKELRNIDENISEWVGNVWNGKERGQVLQSFYKKICSFIDEIRLKLRQNARVICFSEKYDLMLMWSHYADYHKGFVLAYDKNDLKEAQTYSYKHQKVNANTLLLCVKYVDKQTDLTDEVKQYIRHNMIGNMKSIPQIDASVPQIDASISPLKLRQVLIEKSIDWSYEKEWRLINRIPSIEEESPIAYIQCRPKAVILGAHCEGENRKRICDLCQRKQIPAYGIFLSDTCSDFRLQIYDERHTKKRQAKV